MVGMGMGVENGVKAVDIGVEQLPAQIGRGIDENAGFAVRHQDRWPEAPVSRVLRIAFAPAAADQGRSAGMPAAEDGDPH